MMAKFTIRPPDFASYPVTGISFHSARQYAEAIGKRLPTEVEYEFAATNGGNQDFPWGQDDLNWETLWHLVHANPCPRPNADPDFWVVLECPRMDGLAADALRPEPSPFRFYPPPNSTAKRTTKNIGWGAWFGGGRSQCFLVARSRTPNAF